MVVVVFFIVEKYVFLCKPQSSTNTKDRNSSNDPVRREPVGSGVGCRNGTPGRGGCTNGSSGGGQYSLHSQSFVTDTAIRRCFLAQCIILINFVDTV